MTSAIPAAAPTKRAALRQLLSDGAWHHMSELRKAGGWRYGARLKEIRDEDRVEVLKRQYGDNEFEYRLVRSAQPVLPLGPAQKKSAKKRIAELEQQVADLRRQLAEKTSPAEASHV
jgi:bifunctional DNA-binding transcriptional regulator/antitoxin component of YhaV-PrlF toxin-antitoxin module